MCFVGNAAHLSSLDKAYSWFNSMLEGNNMLSHLSDPDRDRPDLGRQPVLSDLHNLKLLGERGLAQDVLENKKNVN